MTRFCVPPDFDRRFLLSSKTWLMVRRWHISDHAIKVWCAPSEEGTHDTLMAVSRNKSLPGKRLRIASLR